MVAVGAAVALAMLLAEMRWMPGAADAAPAAGNTTGSDDDGGSGGDDGRGGRTAAGAVAGAVCVAVLVALGAVVARSPRAERSDGYSVVMEVPAFVADDASSPPDLAGEVSTNDPLGDLGDLSGDDVGGGGCGADERAQQMGLLRPTARGERPAETPTERDARIDAQYAAAAAAWDARRPVPQSV